MDAFVTLGISLGLGLLIGLQRERTESRFGGIRTFPLVSLFGTFCGLLADKQGGWIVAAGIIALVVVVSMANRPKASEPVGEHGQTTEVAALLTYAIGAYLPLGERSIAVVAAGLMVILLHLKSPMHVFVRKMGTKDVAGIMQFVVITLIILPLLPNRSMGPWGVLNPFDIWRMVVLIVGLSLAGYVAYKLVGGTASVVLGGILGGLISSTATTVSAARRVQAAPSAHSIALSIILVASAVSYLRVLIEVSLFAPSHLAAILPPLAAVLAWTCVIATAATVFFFRGKREKIPDPTHPANPADLRSAIIFGLIYAGITLATAAVKDRFGTAGLYGVALVSGLTDMDAITLSLARMMEGQQLEPGNGWRLIVAASISNYVFKGGVAAILGGWRFGLRVAPFFALVVLGAIALMLLWPQGK